MRGRRAEELGRLGYRRIVVSLVSLVVVPTALLLTVGVVLLFLGEANVNVLMGILVLALSGATATGGVLVWVFLRREANLSQLQSDFVSKVSHELRTPLTSIRLFSETLALRRGDAESENKCLQGVVRETTRLQELIDRLLDWGRMESGARQYEIQDVDVSAVARDALHAVEPVREQLGAKITLELETESLRIHADHGALCDAVVNLLTNACKYGGKPPEIRLRVEDGAGDKLKISVLDNGSGIPANEHSRIFQKFYRVDDRLAREKEGSGLGLAIVKHVVRAHGGRVELNSTLGVGSEFTLVLSRRLRAS